MLCFVVNILVASAVLYNIHHSFGAKGKAERKFYRNYFIVVSFLTVLNNTFAFALYYIPHFQIFRALLFGWLSVPFGTGPHFIYNVYIKNIHNLFKGDIDGVIASFRHYVEVFKNKYREIVNNSKKGEISIKFSKTEKELNPPEGNANDSSDVELYNSGISDMEDKKE